MGQLIDLGMLSLQVKKNIRLRTLTKTNRGFMLE